MKKGGRAVQAALPAFLAALTLGIIGLFGMWAGVPWLFPSLGPTVAIQVGSPELPSAHVWNVVAGHLIGIAAGFATVWATGAVDTLAVTDAHQLSGQRVGAAVLAILVSMLVQHALKARHPPAEATTLLIALGALKPTVHTAVTLVAGVLLVMVIGETSRRVAVAYSHKH